MDEIWERAVVVALDGQTDQDAVRSLTLDGAAKCVQGRLPHRSLLEKFQNLQHLSIANISVSSLEQFPHLSNLQKLILSDNRISGGLEFLVEAGLNSLRDLDLSNNRIQFIEDLAPLAELRLVSLDLYECPVTRVKDYRSRVFGLIKSLKYLDKMDAEENERPESDDEEDEDEDEEDDPGSGEIDGEDIPNRLNNGHSLGIEGIVDDDEDEESDADEEETELVRRANGLNNHANGFQFAVMNGEDEGEEEGDDYEGNDSGEEIDDEEGADDDVVEINGIEDSDDEDVVEGDDDDALNVDSDDDEEDEEEEVDNDEADFAEPATTGRLNSTEGEIDGHEQGEDDEEDDDNGEMGEDEEGVEVDGEFEGVEVDGEFEDDEEDEEEDYGAGYLVQPVPQGEEEDAGDSDMDPGNEEEEEVEDDEDEVQVLPPSTSSSKRKRDEDENNNGEDGDDEDDVVDYTKSSKKHP